MTVTTAAAGHSDTEAAAAAGLLGSAYPAVAATPTAAAGHCSDPEEEERARLLLGSASPAVAAAATQDAGAAGRVPAFTVDVTMPGPSSLPPPPPPKDSTASSSSTALIGGEHR